MRKLPDFSEAEQIAHDGFATTVFIGAVGMQAIAATARLHVHQRRTQIIVSQEPAEYRA